MQLPGGIPLAFKTLPALSQYFLVLYVNFIISLRKVVTLNPDYTNNEINSEKNHETYKLFLAVLGG